MIFWLIAALMTCVALAIIIVPLLRRGHSAPKRSEFDLTIYRDQLQELESDQARGLIGPDQSEAARVEIQRRMLAVSEEQKNLPSDEARPQYQKKNWLILLTISMLVPAISIPIYLNLGSPELESQPFASRETTSNFLNSENQATPSLEVAINKLAQRLKTEPNNGEGWFLLGRSFMTIGNYEEAVKALSKASTLLTNNLEIMASLAEAMVFTSGGIVTPEIDTKFQVILSKEPNDQAAQYYLGMARAQAGQPQEALDIWQKLALQTPPDAPWAEDLNSLIARAAEDANVPLNQLVLIPKTVASDPIPGPNADDIAAAADMDPGARMEMIQSMVSQLAARLRNDSADIEGWRRLARAYRVLGENDNARDAERKIASLQEANRSAESAPGPNADDIAAAATLTKAEQSEMISDMVERLAQRLVENPNDLAGWLRLGRSYTVLTQFDDALYAYTQAAKLAPENTSVLSDYARSIINASNEKKRIPTEAKVVYENMIKIDSNNPQALWFLGIAEAAEGRNNSAQFYWEKLLKVLPSDSRNFIAVQQAINNLKMINN